MSVGEVVQRIEGAKQIAAEAPYQPVADGLGKLTVEGTDEVRQGVEALVSGLDTHMGGAQQVLTAAESAGNEFDRATEGTNEAASGNATNALSSLGVMGEKADETLEHMGTMKESLTEALGHLAAFTAAMGKYEAAHLAASKAIGESEAAQRAGIQEMAAYQAAIGVSNE